MLILIDHDVDEPALFGAAAAAHAARLGAMLMHLPAALDAERYPDAVQHPLSEGGLGPSGLIWFERLTGAVAGPAAGADDIAAAALHRDIVVPLHPAFGLGDGLADRLTAEAAGRGAVVERIMVVTDGAALLRRDRGDPIAWRDAFGRILLDPPSAPIPPKITIGLVGSERDQRHVYPANLASLADAADALGIAISIVFVDPLTLRDEGDCAPLLRMDGVVLPGGASMANVPGQIEAAGATLAAGVPTLGLCLGMQTMTTAVARKALGCAANLAEADPQAAVKTFVPIAESADASLYHRTGDQRFDLAPEARLADILSDSRTVRCNHRFRLDEDLLPVLEEHGLRAVARGMNGTVVDAVELSGHPFYMGMQGHPEISSRPGAPHPLVKAFLAAAAERTGAQ